MARGDQRSCVERRLNPCYNGMTMEFFERKIGQGDES